MTEEKVDNPTPEEQSFAEMFEAYTPSEKVNFKVGDKVKGRIISIGDSNIIIDTGSKLDGVASREELQNEEGELPFQEGDSIELYVISLRDGTLNLSKAVSGIGGLNMLQDAFEGQLPVTGKVQSTCKGGFNVEVMQRRAFCPISQIDNKYVEDGESYVGQSYEFQITRLEERGRNIVLSRRKLLEKEQQESILKFTEEAKPGDITKGKITRLEGYGAFVELAPNLEGMVHVSELSWSRVGSPEEIVNVGDEVTVKILDMAKQEKSGQLRISLSVKQAQADPWENVESQFRVGDVISGKVTRCMNFGAFVEIAPGVEGLIHISEMSYVRRVNRPEDIVQPGQVVSIAIKEIDLAKQRIGLSLKEVQGDPWQDVENKFQEGQKVEGTLEKKSEFGYFINLEPGITGLLPQSKISKALKAKDLEKIQPGQKIEVVIEEIKLEEKRISLGTGEEGGQTDNSWKKHTPQQQTQNFGSLGDKLQQAFNKKSK